MWYNEGMRKVVLNRIILIALVVVVLILIVAAITGLGSPKTIVSTPENTTLLTNTPEMSLTMKIRGPIVANEDFSVKTITVSPSSRQYQETTGYLETPPIASTAQNLTNNIKAYDEFIFALEKGQLFNGNNLTAENDLRGVCATGRTYEFTLYKSGTPVISTWSSTCKDTTGNLRGDLSGLVGIFAKQIPDLKL